MANPEAYTRLRAEVDKKFLQGESFFDSKMLSEMEYLNAVMSVFSQSGLLSGSR
jgi:hypothetical protein